MIGTQRKHSRRTFLRGVAAGGAMVTVSLPTFEYMLGSNGTAYADGAAMPPVYLTWGIGNGHPSIGELAPTTTGTGYALTAPLMELAPVHEYVNVITNMHNPLGGGHHQQWSAQVTGTFDQARAGGYGDPLGESIDSLLESRWGDTTRLGSLNVMVSERGYLEGRAQPMLSWGPGGARRPAIPQPREMYQLLFDLGAGTPRPDNAQAEAQNALDRAVLDAVHQDGLALRSKLGRSDQARLDEHLQLIADLESAIGAYEELLCDFPAEPTEFGYVTNHEPLVEKNQIMADLMVLAFSCGITRIGTFQLIQPQGDTIIWQEGASIGWHILTHDADPGNQVNVGADVDAASAQVKRNFSFAMRQANYLLEKMRDTTVGAVNLLDQAAVLMTLEMGEFFTHSDTHTCALTAGRAGGGLRSGVHLPAAGRNRVELLVTVLAALGEDPGELGDGMLRTGDRFDDLLSV